MRLLSLFAPRANDFDGLELVRGKDGRFGTHVVFAPRWWQAWRWLEYALSEERGLCTLTTTEGEEVSVRIVMKGT